MAILSRKIEPHWNYFLAIERDLETLSRYVEFDARNFDCFSIEIARVLLAAGAETDVACKQVCRAADTSSTADNIDRYRCEMLRAFPHLPEFDVSIPRFGLSLSPWDEWKTGGGPPKWWTAYNKTKHERQSEYHRANLKNALNAVAGLFVAILYLYSEKARRGDLVPSPLLLRPGEGHFDSVVHDDLEVGLCYNLK